MSEGHTLIIPKYHSARMDEVPDEYLTEILPLAKKVALSTGYKDYNILQVNETQRIEVNYECPLV